MLTRAAAVLLPLALFITAVVAVVTVTTDIDPWWCAAPMTAWIMLFLLSFAIDDAREAFRGRKDD